MSIYKIVGVVQKVTRSGEIKDITVKRYIRAETPHQAHITSAALGIVKASISWFCNNYEGNLGEAAAYASDNNHGVMTGF